MPKESSAGGKFKSTSVYTVKNADELTAKDILVISNCYGRVSRIARIEYFSDELTSAFP